jgi:redox-sensitive bicupin YhaK (pirin superfamily)
VTTPEGVLVRVISGECHGTSGAMNRPADLYPTQALYLDIHFLQSAHFEQALSPGHRAFIYVYRGQSDVLDAQNLPHTVGAERMGILSNDGDALILHAKAGTRVLLIAGHPLMEPIAQHGPFVMNTRDVLIQAVQDFQRGLFMA